jgi:tetraacyldisaccharide 4'-kinase
MLLDTLYGSITATRNYLYDRKILKVRRLAGPVISVGNISVGGSGKTPFVIMLGKLLVERNIPIDVLSRGYRRSTQGVLRVNPQGTPEEFGDEPLLIARKLQRPVMVGEDRYLAGLSAAREAASAGSDPIHLLDDGWQHRKLHRDFDIVLLNREDLDDRLLPAGRLREPLSSLHRADVVAVDPAFPIDRLPAGDFQVWRVERGIDIPDLNRPVIAFCGIARPQRFFSELRRQGLEVREEITFRDHHRYAVADVQRLAAAQRRHAGSSLVTTEKDAINLGEHLAKLNPMVIPMKVKLSSPDAALEYLLSKIAERRQKL